MSIINPNGPNALTSPNPTFIISREYVSGDIIAVGSEAMGIKSGLINSNGNLMKICKIIVFPGFFVGGADIIKLKLEKTSAEIIIPVIIRK